MDNSRNKIDILYLFLAASVLFHVVFVVIPWIKAEQKKEKEPIIVDLQGPLKWGQVTKMPAPAALPPSIPLPNRPPSPARQQASFARAFPVKHAPAPPPMPAPSGAAGQNRASSPMPLSGEPRQGSVAHPPSPDGYYQQEPPARKLIKPTMEDLNRYAKVDREDTQEAKSETVTLDTQDLMYTSYMQGLKRRIEDIWKYPETARRDGVEGDLVMKFSISKSGRVVDIELIKSSGYPMLDEAAKKALADASPFNPLPENWKKDSFTITGTFIYRLYSGLYLR